MVASRFLALLVLAAALVAVQGTFGGAPTVSDSIELPSSSDDGANDEDGDDVPAFMLQMASGTLPVWTGCSFFDTHRVPAAAPAASRIFRPPISPLA